MAVILLRVIGYRTSVHIIIPMSSGHSIVQPQRWKKPNGEIMANIHCPNKLANLGTTKKTKDSVMRSTVDNPSTN